MWPFAYVLAFMALAGSVALLRANASPDPDLMRAQAIAYNGSVYKIAAMNYAAANPGTLGSVPDVALDLPGWYVNMGWANDVNGPAVTVYLARIADLRTGEIAYAVSQLTQQSWLAGIAADGTLFVSGKGDTGIVLPPGIPAGSPVLIGYAYYTGEAF